MWEGQKCVDVGGVVAEGSGEELLGIIGLESLLCVDQSAGVIERVRCIRGDVLHEIKLYV